MIWLNTNQYATGLAVSLFGYGFSAFVGVAYVGKKLSERAPYEVPGLAQIPFIGPALFRQHPMVYLAIAADRARPCGSSTGAAPAWCCARWASRPSRRMRWATRCAGSAWPRWWPAARCAAWPGAFLSVVYAPLWVEGLVAGRGWIALALTTFATWRPLRVLLGAYLFGGVTMAQFALQGAGVDISSQLLAMLPYLATIVVLAIISRNPTWIRINMPASLGKPFHPGA